MRNRRGFSGAETVIFAVLYMAGTVLGLHYITGKPWGPKNAVKACPSHSVADIANNCR